MKNKFELDFDLPDYLFPFSKIEKDSNVIIYGAGEMGRQYIMQLQKTNYCNVLFAVDRNYKNISDLLNVAVQKPLCIINADYDYIIIAVTEPLSESVKADLKLLDIPENKIIYHLELSEYCLLRKQLVPNCIVQNDYGRMYLADRLKNRRLAIHGIGIEAITLAKLFKLMGIEIEYFIDDESAGNKLEGKEIKHTVDIIYENADELFILIVSNKENYKAYRKSFIDMGIHEDIDFAYYANIEIHSCIFYYDVTLSFNRVKEELEGFELFGDINDPSALRIVALGGSTTESTYSFYKGWAYYLSEILQKKHIPSIIYCGGVGGYTSSQELLKLIRDVLPLNPDIVLSYSGFNDLYSISPHIKAYRKNLNIYKRPFIHPFQVEFCNKILQTYKQKDEEIPVFFNNPGKTENSISYGLENDKTGAEFWIYNTRMMHAIAKEFGILFMSFFQPFLRNGYYNITDTQQAIIYKYGIGLKHYLESDATAIQENVLAIKQKIKKYDYITDLSDIFIKHDNIYFDVVHVYEKGNEIIADNIYSIISPHL